MKNCKYCKTLCDNFVYTCPKCDSTEFVLQQKIKCMFCGIDIPKGAVICPHCHRILPPEEATVQKADTASKSTEKLASIIKAQGEKIEMLGNQISSMTELKKEQQQTMQSNASQNTSFAPKRMSSPPTQAFISTPMSSSFDDVNKVIYRDEQQEEKFILSAEIINPVINGHFVPVGQSSYNNNVSNSEVVELKDKVNRLENKVKLSNINNIRTIATISEKSMINNLFYTLSFVLLVLGLVGSVMLPHLLTSVGNVIGMDFLGSIMPLFDRNELIYTNLLRTFRFSGIESTLTLYLPMIMFTTYILAGVSSLFSLLCMSGNKLIRNIYLTLIILAFCGSLICLCSILYAFGGGIALGTLSMSITLLLVLPMAIVFK